MSRRFLSALLSVITACALVPALASAAGSAHPRGTFEITGGGLGHGIGMSQYGAMGYALHGWNYSAILGHYYAGTTLATTPSRTVTVLLSTGAATFTGASSANGQKLVASRHYGVLRAGSRLTLVSDGRRVARFAAPLKVRGSALSLVGKGRYSGSFAFYPAGSGGVETVNAVSLEQYVRGVLSEEMPASWPAPALEAQAVAARTYVLADTPVSPDYDVYSDTRSQMYGGISAQTSATDAAVAATRGQVVESGGTLIPTYFFASSGGHTESIQDVWVGTSPAPYLTGVNDPYDDSGNNPYYRWSDKLSLAAAAGRLSGLYKGNFLGIKVLSRGTSPRVVSAAVIGSKGESTVSGATLQGDLGTDSTWMSFTTVTARGVSSAGSGTVTTGSATSSGSATTSSSGTPRSSGASSGSGTSSGSGSGFGSTSGSARGTTPAPGGSPSTGGAGIGGDLVRAPRRVLSGSIFPASRGDVVEIQRRTGGQWLTVAGARAGANGAYAQAVSGPGTYRALYNGVAAPSVRLR